MDNANARAEEQTPAPETPEDVAILYSWANLPGAKYRDFSASRREYRAQQRARNAEAQRQAELKAARELEEAARREIEQAQKQVEATRQAEAKAAADAAAEAEAKRLAEEVLRRAEERAERERQEALRRQQSAEELRLLAERAQQEMLEARKRAEEQAARYAEADVQSHVQTREQERVVPGETTDPYYYTGPVDPAYFASTPGVRTAQAARVSTERKAYVYPVHPGSEDFDSGTVVAYRGASQFAPSPSLQSGDRTSSLQSEELDSRASVSQAGVLPVLEQNPNAGYDLDDYYDGDHASRLFSPVPSSRFGENAPADLHIRPATRVSGALERQGRSVRPSPMPQRAQSSEERTADRLPDLFRPSDLVAPAPDVDSKESFPPIPVFRSTDSGVRREARLPEPESEQVMSSPEPFFTAVEEVGIRDEGKLPAIRYEEQVEADAEAGGSRMFIPSPRRRVVQPDAVPTPMETRNRDSAALEGLRRSHAEVETRAALDRFVEEQQISDESPVLSEPTPALPPEAMIKPFEKTATSDEALQWRALNGAGEGGFRRRRQPSREPVVRTVRQPRNVSEPDSGETTEQTAPAWLSGESPSPGSGDLAKVEGGAGPDMPAAPGDPGVPGPRPLLRRQPSSLRRRVPRPVSTGETPGEAASSSPGRPAADQRRSEDEARSGTSHTTSNDTLQQSRERVASRWFALSGLMGSERGQSAETRVGLRSAPRPAPVVCVLSISGGVGKTSIVATLGRALSSMGEKVMLADTNVHGILPYYFGAREQRPGAVRTFSPPPGSSDAPVVLVSYDADSRGYDETGQTEVLEDLSRRANEVQRVLIDAGVNSAWLARTIAGTNPWVLVPVAPDMNSVLGTQSVERLFKDVTGADGRQVKPYYVLNQYDPTVPLHLDVREVLRQFLGDRLLPIMLHRTPVVSEALAEGMTVIDYAPRAPIATDYMNLAAWVRKLADPGMSYARPARWSER